MDKMDQFKVIPGSIALRISTAHNFTRDQSMHIKNSNFFFTAGPHHNCDLSFFCFELNNKFLYVKYIFIMINAEIPARSFANF